MENEPEVGKLPTIIKLKRDCIEYQPKMKSQTILLPAKFESKILSSRSKKDLQNEMEDINIIHSNRTKEELQASVGYKVESRESQNIGEKHKKIQKWSVTTGPLHNRTEIKFPKLTLLKPKMRTKVLAGILRNYKKQQAPFSSTDISRSRNIYQSYLSQRNYWDPFENNNENGKRRSSKYIQENLISKIGEEVEESTENMDKRDKSTIKDKLIDIINLYKKYEEIPESNHSGRRLNKSMNYAKSERYLLGESRTDEGEKKNYWNERKKSRYKGFMEYLYPEKDSKRLKYQSDIYALYMNKFRKKEEKILLRTSNLGPPSYLKTRFKGETIRKYQLIQHRIDKAIPGDLARKDLRTYLDKSCGKIVF